jgi:hypothetical protein
MTRDCANCGRAIDGETVRYTEHTEEGSADYCSVNCIADVDHVDEARAQQRLFVDHPEA